jgi:hypothetical protein
VAPVGALPEARRAGSGEIVQGHDGRDAGVLGHLDQIAAQADPLMHVDDVRAPFVQQRSKTFARSRVMRPIPEVGVGVVAVQTQAGPGQVVASFDPGFGPRSETPVQEQGYGILLLLASQQLCDVRLDATARFGRVAMNGVQYPEALHRGRSLSFSALPCKNPAPTWIAGYSSSASIQFLSRLWNRQ